MTGIEKVWALAQERAAADGLKPDVWLAYKAKVSASLVRYWKNEARGIPSTKHAIAVAELTGVSIRELVPDAKDKKPSPPAPTGTDGEAPRTRTGKAHASKSTARHAVPEREVAQYRAPRIMGTVRNHVRKDLPCQLTGLASILPGIVLTTPHAVAA